MEALFTGEIPGLDIDLTKVLHGEHYFKIVKPLSYEAKLTNTFKIQVDIVIKQISTIVQTNISNVYPYPPTVSTQDVLDKGSGMVLLIEIESRDEAGDLVTVNQQSIFVVGDGGFGGPRSSEHTISVAQVPDREPDKVAVFKTSEDQAALYRMSGQMEWRLLQ